MSVSWRVESEIGGRARRAPHSHRARGRRPPAPNIRDETAGVGNGSTFQQIAVIFDKTLAPPVLGWSSAIASFGALLAGARAHLRRVCDACTTRPV